MAWHGLIPLARYSPIDSKLLLIGIERELARGGLIPIIAYTGRLCPKGVPLFRLFRLSFHLDWQIDNGIFNRPIMTSTQILVNNGEEGGRAKNKDFGASQTDLTRVQIRLWRRLLLGSTSISFMKLFPSKIRNSFFNVSV